MTALVLGVAAGGFVAWTGRPADAVLVAAVATYPFAAYAVVRDDDPTTVLPPAAVALAGLVVWLAAPLGALVSGNSVIGAVTLGTVLASPPVAYAVRYGERGPPPRVVLVAGVLVGLGWSTLSLATENAAGAFVGPLVALGGAGYAWHRGSRYSRARRGGAVVAGVLAACVTLGVTALGHVSTGPALVGAAAFVLAPTLFYAATLETTAFD